MAGQNISNEEFVQHSMFKDMTDEQFRQFWVDFKKSEHGCVPSKGSLCEHFWNRVVSIYYRGGADKEFYRQLAYYACAKLDNLLGNSKRK